MNRQPTIDTIANAVVGEPGLLGPLLIGERLSKVCQGSWCGLRRNLQNFGWGKPTLESPVEAVSRNGGRRTPLFKRPRLSIEGDGYRSCSGTRSPRVLRLILHGLPAAVLLAIGAIVVDPPQTARAAVAGGLSNFSEEHGEVSPALIERNSSSTIVGVLGVVGVGTTRLHRSPGCVHLGSRHPMGLTDDEVSSRCGFASVTSTRDGSSQQERSPEDAALSSALAPTGDVTLSVRIENFPTAINIFKWFHSSRSIPQDRVGHTPVA